MATPNQKIHSENVTPLVRKIMDDPLLRRPLFICLGPLPVLCFLWIFFAITFIKPLALRDYLAPHVKSHAQSATMIISMIATILASYISYFFSMAVRYVIAIRLTTTSTSLDVLNSATRIAQKSLWLHDPRVKWTWIVLLAYIGVSVQTSGLIAFLTVREIQFSQNLKGRDLNFADPQVLRMSSGTTLPSTYDSLASFFLQSAMVDAMMVEKNVSSTFNLNGYTYLSTTGGIHPATYVPIHDQQFTTNASIMVPANLDDVTKSRHFTLPFNKSMELTQQGFTADVDCRLRNTSDFDRYRPTLSGTNITGTNGLTMVSLSATCPGTTTAQVAGPVVFNTTDILNSGGLLGVACLIPNTFSYDIILRATGAYERNLDLMTCTVIPKTTLVNVKYALSPQDTIAPTTIQVSEPMNKTDVPVWGRFAVEMLLYNLLLGQSTMGNTVANAWLFGPGVTNLVPTEMMNTYIRAGAEFSGTVIRQIWMEPGTPFSRLDSNSSVFAPIQGTFSATTYGWHQTREVSPLLLLPSTVIIIATYCIVFYGLQFARRHRKDLHVDDLDFDPTNIVHVIAAHAPETRKDEFRSFSHQSTGYMRHTAVQMQSRDGVRAFAVSARPHHHSRSSESPIGDRKSAEDLEELV